MDEEDAPQGIELIGHHEDVSNLLKVEHHLHQPPAGQLLSILLQIWLLHSVFA